MYGVASSSLEKGIPYLLKRAALKHVDEDRNQVEDGVAPDEEMDGPKERIASASRGEQMQPVDEYRKL